MPRKRKTPATKEAKTPTNENFNEHFATLVGHRTRAAAQLDMAQVEKREKLVLLRDKPSDGAKHAAELAIRRVKQLEKQIELLDKGIEKINQTRSTLEKLAKYRKKEQEEVSEQAALEAENVEEAADLAFLEEKLAIEQVAEEIGEEDAEEDAELAKLAAELAAEDALVTERIQERTHRVKHETEQAEALELATLAAELAAANAEEDEGLAAVLAEIVRDEDSAKVAQQAALTAEQSAETARHAALEAEQFAEVAQQAKIAAEHSAKVAQQAALAVGPPAEVVQQAALAVEPPAEVVQQANLAAKAVEPGREKATREPEPASIASKVRDILESQDYQAHFKKIRGKECTQEDVNKVMLLTSEPLKFERVVRLCNHLVGLGLSDKADGLLIDAGMQAKSAEEQARYFGHCARGKANEAIRLLEQIDSSPDPQAQMKLINELRDSAFAVYTQFTDIRHAEQHYQNMERERTPHLNNENPAPLKDLIDKMNRKFETEPLRLILTEILAKSNELHGRGKEYNAKQISSGIVRDDDFAIGDKNHAAAQAADDLYRALNKSVDLYQKNGNVEQLMKGCNEAIAKASVLNNQRDTLGQIYGNIIAARNTVGLLFGKEPIQVPTDSSSIVNRFKETLQKLNDQHHASSEREIQPDEANATRRGYS